MKILICLLFLTIASGHASEVKLLSWNVFMLPKPIWFSMQPERTIAIAQELKKLDHELIFLQEAFIDEFREHLYKELKTQYPYEYYLDGSGFLYPILGSGTYVLSKYPFKLLDKLRFRDCNREDCFAAKGAMLIEADLPQGRVQFINTHMQAKSTLSETRLKQLGEIKLMMEKHLKPGIPQVLVGDLNLNFAEPEFLQGIAITQMDYVKISGPILTTNRLQNKCYKTPAKGGVHHWIDHAWVRGIKAEEATMQVLPILSRLGEHECFLSDHHAMDIRLKLSSPQL